MIDTHAHLTSPSVLNLVDELLERAKASGIEKVVNICTDPSSLEKGIQLRQKYPWVFNAAATTPHDLVKDGETFFPMVEQEAKKNSLVAIGETGLDYFYEHSPKEIQKKFLSRYFELALQLKLPIIFHCRDAFADLFAQADQEYKEAPAILHCFTGSIDEARGVLDRGWYLSFSGIVTYKKSEALREVARYVPLDRILIETDTPYLAPQSQRGKQNEPSFLVETAERIAREKNIPFAECVAALSNNACNIFGF